LARLCPHVGRPLAQLSVIVEGKEILLRQGDGLVEPGGQLRFDFAAAEVDEHPSVKDVQATGAEASCDVAPQHAETAPLATAASPAELAALAAHYEEEGELETAVDLCRAAMSAGGPKPELCFQLAELLYRRGDLAGARERYFVAIELDEDYVEARANLGCVLAELGQHDLARAAFEGALAFHPDYSDVHFHLAGLLDAIGHRAAAADHWRAFLRLAPTSPWADQARLKLGEQQP
jgi:tetratricopeptide (TPR) repeat protein